MSDKNSNGFFSLIEENWKKVLLIGGITAGVVQVIPRVQENLRLYIFAFLGVIGVIGFGACIYYAFLWQPKVKDSGKSPIIIPGSGNSVKPQGKKKKQQKIVQRLAILGLFLIPAMAVGSFWQYQYTAKLPPQDFKILVADFESADSSNYDVTRQIFSNLETEMRDYGDDVTVEKLGKPLESKEEAKQAGKQKKAAIVIWGNYSATKEVVPIRVNFQIQKEFTDHFELSKSVQGKTQITQISELESFQLQTSLSQEMSYLSFFTLGMYRYLEEDWQQAIEDLERALEVSQETDKPIASLGTDVVNFYLGTSAYNLELYDNSLKFLDRAVEINPNLDEAWDNRGVALNRLGKYQQAIASFNKAIEINPDGDTAWNNRGIAFDNLGEHEQAISDYDKAIKINPNLDEAWNNRGVALDNLGEYQQAISSYDKAIKINPDDLAWYNHGVALNRLGEYQQAISSYDKAIKINPDLDEAWNNRGTAFGALGRYEQAITSYDRAVEINPDSDDAWYNRGLALYGLGKYQQAITSYDRAIEINPDDDAAWYNRGLAFGNLGEYQQAIASYDQAIEINSDSDAAWYNRGVALGNLGKHEQAIASFDKAIEINPNYDSARYNIAVGYALQGEIDSTLKNLKQAFDLNPELQENAKTNSAFDAIREDKRFKQLMKTE